MDATGYALRKVVQNSSIVREIDEVRQREMWQWVWMGVVLVLVLLASITLHLRLLKHAYDMETLQRAMAAEQETNRQLHLDIETLSSPRRIEDLAIGRLHMVAPALDDAVVIQRVVSPERPPSSVVAAR
jgi:cell division protein FtsL